jgi:hypothetical protein
VPNLIIRADSATGIFGGGGSSGLQATGVSGTFEDGNEITIFAQGSEDFGTGPVTVLYSTLSGGVNGASVSTSAPEIGSYSTTEGAYYSNVAARSGGTAVVGYDDPNQIMSLRAAFPAATQVAIRYWTYVPTDKALPCCEIGGYSAYRSGYKWCWLGQNSGMTGGGDICIPTMRSGTDLSIQGNGLAGSDTGAQWLRYPTGSPPDGTIFAHFRYGEWIMVEGLMDSVNERIRINHCGATIGMQQYTKAATGFWGDAPAGARQFTNFNLPGYVTTDPLPDAFVLSADECVKTGPGCWADVLLINASTIAAATDIRHVLISSWNSSTIQGTIIGCDSVDLEGYYVAIRKADDTYLTTRLIS